MRIRYDHGESFHNLSTVPIGQTLPIPIQVTETNHSTVRVAAKQHFKNFAKHEIWRNYFDFRKISRKKWLIREIPDPFREIFAKIL